MLAVLRRVLVDEVAVLLTHRLPMLDEAAQFVAAWSAAVHAGERGGLGSGLVSA
jgi:hypothetical protein